MPRLIESELEGYKGLSVLGLEEDSITGLGRISIENLKSAERKLIERGYYEGLPFYIADKHHREGKGIHYLAEEIIGVGDVVLVRMLHYFHIPRLNRSEVSRVSMEISNKEPMVSPTIQKEIMGAYDHIALHRDITNGWKSVVPEVSEITGHSEEVVETYLERLFRE